jgi:hypothetical protein
MKRFCLTIMALPLAFSLWSQELQCNIQISTQSIPGSNKQVFQTLQSSLNEFINGTSWTNYKFSVSEKIECSMLLNIQSYSGDQFKGTIQIQARRPVFNSSYNSVLFNYLDEDLDFRYVEFQPLEINENANTSNLTSIVAFYAYIIIGLDFDSFGSHAGTEFFQKAEKIVDNSQSVNERGWKAGESTSRRNRYWLANSILNDEYAPIRDFMYSYHRLGLDVMYDKPVEGRTAIMDALRMLQEVHNERPDPYMHFLQVILDAKSDEFVNIFQGALDDEKRRATSLLSEIDPSHAEKYRKILSATK